MNKEIERKFLVKDDSWKNLGEAVHYKQGYLSNDPERTVRVRIAGEKGFLTVKGKSTNDGLTRLEWEKELSVEEISPLFSLCLPGIIEKNRTKIQIGSHTFEVDEFFGQNDGLILAEVELRSESESFEIPDWLGEEVTGDKRYYNSYLAQHPFSTW
ncbi:CYTH domain-containing protein [Sediminitomix flava]|uniref:CYTH domain-containing protein n=1 Tax=Sediminitomix flava TaxID=379075 RepID=A0A315ZD35_SEDFL|nr:CYTH domain-containing protein [Sediminitomix flava]PWJ42758.1 CYTH domain-containing protein [Sediminitomix flava]